jgi:hypothetical protein
MARTIQSPGVEINEVDLTLRADTNVGTNVFITGFANQGPIDEVLQPTSISEFEQIYGLPTNAAERYFYHTAKSVLNSSPANVLVSRLPYGVNKGEGFSSWRYSALAYPVIARHLFSYEVSSYALNTVFVSNSGAGYTNLPSVIATGGSNSFLKALTADDGLGTNTFGVTSVEIIDSGVFETEPPITFSPSYIISNFVLAASGSGYLSAPDILLANSTFTVDASARVKTLENDGIGLFSYSLVTTNVTTSGSGLTQPPLVQTAATGIVPATFVANLAPDNLGTGTFGVTSITTLTEGTYRGDLSRLVTFVGGGTNPSRVLPTLTTPMAGTTQTTFGIKEIEVVRTGKGYNQAPTVSLSLDSEFNNPANILVIGNNRTPVAVADGVQNAEIVFDKAISVVDDSVSLGGNEYFKEADLNESYKYYGKTCYIGRPTHIELTPEEYQAIQDGNINWSNYPTVTADEFAFNTIGNAAFIVLNESQSTVNNKFEGYYVGTIDNSNYNPATDFNGILNVRGIQDSQTSIKTYTHLPNTRLGFGLSANKTGDGSSISEVMENLSNFDLSDDSFDDSISFGLFKLRQNVFSKDVTTIDYALAENYVGSIDFHREIGDPNGGLTKTFSIEKLSRDSRNVHIVVNPYLSDRYTSSSIRINGNPAKRVRFLTQQLSEYIVSNGYIETDDQYRIRTGTDKETIQSLINEMGSADSLFPLGIYDDRTVTDKKVGHIPTKIERALELVDNSDVYQIDLAVEGGLGTIYVNAIEQSGFEGLSAGEFTDSVPLKSLSALYTTNYDNLDEVGSSIRNNYTSVANVFINAAEKQRKDFLVILDPLRNIFVQGDNSKIANSKKIWSPNAGIDPDPNAAGYVASNFSQHIYWPLRHQFGTINCSYATAYANWAQISDSITSRQIWIPFSGIAASIMANTDANFQPWYAPAGFTRGIVTGVNDLGVYAKQKQRDQLYKISLNPVAFFPNEGFTVFGQKTMLKKPSAFDRINVRRLFLALEKATKNTAKFFVFEPNTLFTRTQVINVLSPIFENAKNTEGLYDYRIVCSELNNTPDVIDNNELKIDIYIQPVRTAEFILVNFYATRTGTSFDELIGA